jgi:hypothetical protein
MVSMRLSNSYGFARLTKRLPGMIDLRLESFPKTKEPVVITIKSLAIGITTLLLSQSAQAQMYSSMTFSPPQARHAQWPHYMPPYMHQQPYMHQSHMYQPHMYQPQVYVQPQSYYQQPIYSPPQYAQPSCGCPQQYYPQQSYTQPYQQPYVQPYQQSYYQPYQQTYTQPYRPYYQPRTYQRSVRQMHRPWQRQIIRRRY